MIAGSVLIESSAVEKYTGKFIDLKHYRAYKFEKQINFFAKYEFTLLIIIERNLRDHAV